VTVHEEVMHEDVQLPKRQLKGDYVEPDYPLRRIPEKYQRGGIDHA
jgi:hypothetical protein